jgi:hypothetical protein
LINENIDAFLLLVMFPYEADAKAGKCVGRDSEGSGVGIKVA